MKKADKHKVQYEPALPTSLLEIKSSRGKHSTEKPVALMEWILKYYSKEGDVVLDPTMGSGSTGVSCKNMNRNFIGIEMDDEIYEGACARIWGEQKIYKEIENIIYKKKRNLKNIIKNIQEKNKKKFEFIQNYFLNYNITAMSLTEIIKKKRPNLKDISINQYTKSLNKLKELFESDDFEFLKDL